VVDRFNLRLATRAGGKGGLEGKAKYQTQKKKNGGLFFRKAGRMTSDRGDSKSLPARKTSRGGRPKYQISYLKKAHVRPHQHTPPANRFYTSSLVKRRRGRTETIRSNWGEEGKQKKVKCSQTHFLDNT